MGHGSFCFHPLFTLKYRCRESITLARLEQSMRNFLLLLGVAVIPFSGSAQATQELAGRLNQPIPIERGEDIGSAQLERHMGKLMLTAEVNDEARRFIFDTGSPTMISKELADQLNLQTIGSNVGRDANGREVRTDFAVVDELELAGTVFRNVPVMIFDFDQIDPHGCFFDGGVIGSEIFPGSAWRISTERLTLEIAETVDAFSVEADNSNSISIPMSDFGYPHAPIFDYRIGELRDKGLFDTGNSATFVLFKRVSDDASVRNEMRSGSIVEGRGSEGVSAGGLGDTADLMRLELQSVGLGSTEIGPLEAIVRHAPPTLMGLGILEKFNVTLDYPNSRLLLEERQVDERREAYPGFGLMALEGEVRVMQMFSDTPAEAAGLMLGDRVIAIDEANLPSADQPCALQEWLIETRPAALASSVTVLRNGKPKLIRLRNN